jgi:hypothetical protein
MRVSVLGVRDTRFGDNDAQRVFKPGSALLFHATDVSTVSTTYCPTVFTRDLGGMIELPLFRAEARPTSVMSV